VLELLGRIPKPGEIVDVDGRQAEVTEVDDARVLELRFPGPALGEMEAL
jgi:CBS domain containing-hemolysin-like protein